MTDTATTPYHHGDLEQALTVEALEQVRSRGTGAVSLRQVAQAVGVSPSAAYAHFPDKTALMSAVGRCGLDELSSRTVAATEAIAGDDDLSAVARFRAAGEAYVLFAIEEPHLFRHVFGPDCPFAQEKHGDQVAPDAVAYQVLCRALDDLEARGLLRSGAREGLDLVAWTMVHGFASLALDGFLPPEVGDLVIDALARLAFSDEGHVLLTR